MQLQTSPSCSRGCRWSILPLVLVSLLVPGGLRAQEARGPLAAGAEVDGELRAGERHAYELQVRAGRPLLVSVEQLAVDLVLEAHTAAGRELAVDTPTGDAGIELLLVEDEGPATLEVHAGTAFDHGRYRLRVEEPDASTEEGRQRLEVGRLFTRAAMGYAAGTGEGRQEALAGFQQVLALQQAARSMRETGRLRHIVGVLLREAGDLDAARAMLVSALPPLGASAERALEARVALELGVIAWQRGDARAATGFYRGSLKSQEGLGNLRAQAQLWNNLGLVHHTAGELKLAVEAYQRALELAQADGDPGLAAAVLNNHGSVARDAGEPAEALELFERALAAARQAGDRQLEARVLSNLGAAHRALGEFPQALGSYLAALEVVSSEGDAEGEATVLSNVGVLYLALGQPERAQAHFLRALSLTTDDRATATTLHNLAQARDRLGEADEARADYWRALRLHRQAGNRRGEATALELLSDHYRRAGRLDLARGAIGQALEVRQQLGDLRREARALRRLGEVEGAMGELAAGRSHLAQALELQRRLGDRPGLAESLFALGEAERRDGELDAARTALDESLAIIESLRVQAGDPQTRASFLATQRRVYEGAVALRMDLHLRQPARRWDLEALAVAERARARGLLDLLREAGAELGRNLPAELQERRRRLARQLYTLAEVRVEGGDPATLEEEVEGASRQLDGVEAEIRQRDPAYAAVTRRQPLEPGEIQRLLDDGTLVLEYFLGAERSWLWAIRRDRVAAFELPGREEIEAAVRGVYELWSTLDLGAGTAPEEAAAGRLAEMLLGPVAVELGDSRLVVVPDGALHYLPFGALPDPAHGAGVEPLLERHEVVTLPSASVLGELRGLADRRTAASGTVAVLADPVFSRLDPRLPPLPPGEEAPDGPLDRLAGSRQEAEVIAALVPPASRLVALDAGASRQLVLGGGLAGYRILHFATHGLFDSEHPALSGLALSRFDAAGRPVDGLLHLGDIYGLELHADLVVLSGCRTALGREIQGEGLVGLTQGFHYAGAPRVMASLWRVQDLAMAELMGRFYQGLLRDGLAAAAALRAAQRGMRRDPRWRDPYFWAVMTLQGDWQ